ncbi:hypothetical protein [Microbacterium sp. JZ31]|uniref:hypothetical protein n=1 Tax=Microbacterium sp. JZ31 TaxID=1906274 RepID=UPI001EE42B6A|nr:hypothetical protein [Microbacterium sp. JZ31]
MDQATASAPLSAAPAAGGPARPAGRGGSLKGDLVILGVVGVLLAGAIWAGFSALHRQFWGPSAFVERYIAMLSEGDAAGALAVPGVTLDSTDLEAAGLPASASDALLRKAALTFDISDVEITSEREVDGVVEVTASYRIDGTAGSSAFRVERIGTEGLVPRWSFETSPLAELRVGVRGSMQFAVNGFELDKRQVSPDGSEADPMDAVSLLVFSPGIYSVDVDTAMAEADPVHVLADTALHSVPLDIQAEPSKAFVDVVEEKVSAFLTDCATQEVMQPTGCPFGMDTHAVGGDRVLADTIDWTIPSQPPVVVVPSDEYFAISAATGTAHFDADVVSLFDGSVYHVSEDVPFVIDGTVDVLPDGTASILIGSPALR